MAPGKTAPRLLQDLLVYDPRYEERAGRNILTSPPPHFDPNKPRSAAVPFRNCRHALLVKHEQSQPPSPGEEIGPETIYKIASYCEKCRWHIDVIVDLRSQNAAHKPCRNGDEDYMLHHFMFVEETSQHDANGLGAQLAPRTYEFRCSAPPCPARLQIRLKPPHFSDQDIETLTNQAILRRRWEAAKQIAGERADANMARRADGPDFLNTYLSDALNPVRGKARIPLLNKKFLKTFGKDCDAILNRLGFSKQLEEDDTEIAEVWYLPRPEESADIFESSLRSTIEDARYELNTIILEIPENERIGARHTPLYPPPARDLIERALGCNDYFKVPGRVATRSDNHEEDHPHYASLGTLADFADELILFAFSRQVAVDNENHAYYFECLQDLARGRQSETLAMQVAMLGSQGITSRREADEAYQYFGIDPGHAMHINDEHIIGVFKSRLSDMSPSMAEETRRQLRVIGDARNSEVIRAEATGALETYEQALSWLDLDESQADDFVPTMFTLKIQDNPSSLETARKAVSLIAEHRNSQRLRQFLEEGTMEAPEMDMGEAYALFMINDRTAKVDFDVMKTMISFGSSESAEKMQKAYKMIEQDQAQNLNNRSNQSEVRRNNYPLESWPVGLRNIGNTCYLNSVLQFLFTIKPLRELVLDCDRYLQDPSPEALKGKKVGRTAVTAERVEVAQKFVHELRTFFQYMITAPTDTVQPAIDLAALALCKTDIPQTAPQSPKVMAETGEGLGTIEGLPISGPMLPVDDAATATNPTSTDSVMDDAKSDTSMQAMELESQSKQDEASSKPAPPTRPPPVPPRPAPQAPSGKSRLGNIEESARQQDAAEVLSNIFDLFSCAIKGDGVLSEDEQLDTIKKLFFSDVTSVRNTKPKPEQTNELRDHFLVSPGWRDRNLYATLDDDFGLSEMDGGITKYDYIKTAAPIQIINLRRLQFDRAKGEQVYDRSHIGLEPTLYLDRYLMETQTLPQLELLKLRQEQWDKQRQLHTFDERRDQLRKTEIEGLDLPDVLEETSAFIQGLSDQYSEETPENRSLPTPPPELAESLLAKSTQLKQELSEIDARMTQLESEINEIFSNSHDHPYRLHSVFTHRGGTKGGHYWIYIYDFQNGMWRKYNDDQVTVADERDIFEREQANIPPASTGVVYIREDLIDEFTQAVCRVPEVEKPVESQNDVQMTDATPVRYDDVKIIDGVEMQYPVLKKKKQKFMTRQRRGRISLPPPAEFAYSSSEAASPQAPSTPSESSAWSDGSDALELPGPGPSETALLRDIEELLARLTAE